MDTLDMLNYLNPYSYIGTLVIILDTIFMQVLEVYKGGHFLFIENPGGLKGIRFPFSVRPLTNSGRTESKIISFSGETIDSVYVYTNEGNLSD